jgi:hypothetical protein
MKKSIYSLIILLLLICHGVNGQKTMYSTTGGEWIFSSASASDGGANANTIVRFSPVLNLQNQLHYDVKEKLGFFTGFSIRNVGFIYDDVSLPNQRTKARTYTLGIPLAIKVGDMTGMYLFGGYELELPFNYKEKVFVDGDKKSKSSDWFSSKTPGLYNTLFVGVQTPYGTQLKFKYYMTNFFNKSYGVDDGSGTGTIKHPYQNFDANVFYISLSFQILKGTDFYYSRTGKK